MLEQQNVSITGEVMFAGLYTLDRRNARLSELFKKAGGGLPTRHTSRSRIIRKANEQEKQRMEAVLKMQREEMQKNLLQLSRQQQQCQCPHPDL